MTSQTALFCQGLEKSYRDVVALAGVDLGVLRGECFGLLGPNGAGKTTTVEILEGLRTPDAGKVEVLGMEWRNGHDRELRGRLGVVLQEAELPEALRVEEVVRLFRSFYRRGHEVGEVLDWLELGPMRRRAYGQLSRGQKQRVGLACALVGRAEVLFLDEPTSGLDPMARRNIWDLVEHFKASGGTVLLTTHNMEEATRLCDRVAIMDEGRILTTGTPRDLIASLGSEHILELEVEPSPAADEFLGLPSVRHADLRLGRLVLRVEDVATALAGVLAHLGEHRATLQTLAVHQATLEDVFIARTGRTLRKE